MVREMAYELPKNQLAESTHLHTLSLVIPVFNNSQSLPHLFERLQALENSLLSLGIVVELIFVDDGSTDGSLRLIKDFQKFRPNIKLIKLIRNTGAIHASRAGVKLVSGDVFMVLAADLQDPPELLIEMCQEWLNGSRFVICVRTSRKDPIFSKLLSRIGQFLIRRMVFSNYPKGGFDMALIDSLFLDVINSGPGYGSVPLQTFSLGISPHTLNYSREERKGGVSGWTFTKKFEYLLDLIFGYSKKPLRLMSAVGFTVAFLSFLFGMVIIFSALTQSIPVPGFATLALLMSFLVGVQLLMVGIIGEYVWRIYQQVIRQPASIIEEMWTT
jgi:glycosyltransferase involved in cell wall biosynthesis